MNLMPIYSVPLWQSEYPNFEEEKEIFLKTIYEYKDQNQSIQKSNIFGYHSPENFHQIEVFRPLFEYICKLGNDAITNLEFISSDIAITSSWVNINDSRQCMNSDHVHGDTLSGVFYLKVPEGSGRLVIKNPAINRVWQGCSMTEEKNQFTAEIIKIDPVEGDIIIFPSYLPHSVETNNHDDERISISFNIIAVPKGTIGNSYPKE